MSFSDQLAVFLRARYPVLAINTLEEARLEQTIVSLAKNLGRSVYIWDFVDGYTSNPTDAGQGKRNPLQALEFVEKIPQGAVFILRDFDRFLDDIAIGRKLKNLDRRLQELPQNLILIAPQFTIPDALREVITVLNFPLPTPAEIKAELSRLCPDLSPTEELIAASQGLSLDRLRRVVGRAIANQELDQLVDLVLTEKQQSIRQTQILEFYPTTTTVNDIGGLASLKEWLKLRGGAFSAKARRYGLPYPRGLMLVGIQGTGKSLTAKAIAHEWHLPLLRLDVGRLFGGLVGESEARTRQMIQLAEAMSPCVLWIDEIDKAFTSSDSRGDGGTTSRVFATFLTWMAEKTSSVFVVATANNIKSLPSELLRKGRFDEVFFVGLPNQQERAEILAVHLSKYRPHSLRNYDLERLAYETPDFSGAELEQAVIEAMHIGFSQNRDFTNEDIITAASQIVPLARTAQAEVQFLQDWVTSGRIRSASS
ncbi:MAG: AAA family ATPase [Pseudanabaenaceae cyanobacterium]